MKKIVKKLPEFDLTKAGHSFDNQDKYPTNKSKWKSKQLIYLKTILKTIEDFSKRVPNTLQPTSSMTTSLLQSKAEKNKAKLPISSLTSSLTTRETPLLKSLPQTFHSPENVSHYVGNLSSANLKIEDMASEDLIEPQASSSQEFPFLGTNQAIASIATSSAEVSTESSLPSLSETELIHAFSIAPKNQLPNYLKEINSYTNSLNEGETQIFYINLINQLIDKEKCLRACKFLFLIKDQPLQMQCIYSIIHTSVVSNMHKRTYQALKKHLPLLKKAIKEEIKEVIKQSKNFLKLKEKMPVAKPSLERRYSTTCFESAPLPKFSKLQSSQIPIASSSQSVETTIRSSPSQPKLEKQLSQTSLGPLTKNDRREARLSLELSASKNHSYQQFVQILQTIATEQGFKLAEVSGSKHRAWVINGFENLGQLTIPKHKGTLKTGLTGQILGQLCALLKIAKETQAGKES
jgi:hypothetical protein